MKYLSTGTKKVSCLLMCSHGKKASLRNLKSRFEVYLFSVAVPGLLCPSARLLESLQPLCVSVQLSLLCLELALQQSDLQLQLYK